MKRFIISFVLFFAMGSIFAVNGTLSVTSVESTPVTGITVITFDLHTTQIPEKVSETYNILVEVSFEGGVSGSYMLVPSAHLSGDVKDVSPGTGKQIIWDGGAGFPNIYSIEAKVRLTASSANAGTFVDSRDGQTYKWVRIGGQVWMAENLRYLPGVIGPSTESAITPHYYVYDYDGTDINAAKVSDNFQNYGVLYNWPAAITACPPGWSLPTGPEWEQMISYLGSRGYPNQSNDPNGAGNALKSCRQVDSPIEGCNTSDHPRWNANDTHRGFDAFGFSALPGGYRIYNGGFINLGSRGFWWSATSHDASVALHQIMFDTQGRLAPSYNRKESGFSLRCVKDGD